MKYDTYRLGTEKRSPQTYYNVLCATNCGNGLGGYIYYIYYFTPTYEYNS